MTTLEIRRRFLSFDKKRDACPTIAFSPDGRMLVCASAENGGAGALGSSFAVIDVASGSVKSASTTAGKVELVGVRPASFSPDGKLVAVGTRGCNVELFTADGLAHVRSVEGFDDWLCSLAFSPDGAQLAAASKGHVRIVDVGTGKDVRKVSGKGIDASGWIQALSWQPAGLFVASTASPSLWDNDGKLVATWVAKKKGYALSGFAVNAASVAGCGHFGPSTIWDRETKAIAFQPKDAKDGRAVTLSPDGQWLAHLDGKGTVALIEVSSGGAAAKLNLEWPESDDAMFTCSLAFAPDGKTIVCGHAWGVVEIGVT